MVWVRLGSICSIKFDWFGNLTHTKFGVRFGSIAELNRAQSNPWIEFDFPIFDLLCRESLQKSIRGDAQIWNPFESLLNITALLVRLPQTIAKISRNKIPCIVFPIVFFYLHTLQYVVPLLLIAPSWGTSPISWLKVPLFQAGGIREIKHRECFSRERQRRSHDLTFATFAVCRPPFLLEEDIFPVWRER